MKIIRLKKEDYEGKRFTASYTTGGYYDIRSVDSGFLIKYVPFAAPEKKAFDDVFFGSGWRLRRHSVRLRTES